MEYPESVLISQKLNQILSVKDLAKELKYYQAEGDKSHDLVGYGPERTGLPITSLNEDGSLTNMAGDRFDQVSINGLKPAESEEDFREIFERELEASGHKEESETIHRLFRQDLIEQVSSLVNSYQNCTQANKTRDLALIEKANRFTAYIESLGSGNKAKQKTSSTIVVKERLALIYRKYKDEFKESEDLWISRFVYPNDDSVNSIDISKKAAEGSSKLILVAILSSISKTTENAFCYSDFVQKRFGILNFDKTVSDHKEKQTFKSVLKECNAILKI